MSDTPSTAKPGDWRRRRRVIYWTLIYCGAQIAYLNVFGSDTALHQQLGIALIALAGSVTGSCVFGAVWDDHNARKAGE
jgi:hypothetical protein